MGKKWKMFLFFGAVIVLVSLGIFFALGKDNTTKNAGNNGSGDVAGAVSSQGNDYIERLSKFLSDNGMVLYGSDQSAETKQQKYLFGNAVNSIDYVNCDVAANSSNPDECVGQNITIYPTWVYKEVKFEGIQSLSELAKITDFEQ